MDDLPPNLHKSSLTSRYQYREASTNPYTTFLSYQISSLLVSFGSLTITFLSYLEVLSLEECWFDIHRVDGPFLESDHCKENTYAFPWTCWPICAVILLLFKSNHTTMCFNTWLAIVWIWLPNLVRCILCHCHRFYQIPVLTFKLEILCVSLLTFD